MVFEHSAIVLEPGKEYLIESRLAPVLRAEGLESFDALINGLRGSDAVRLRGLVIDAMTTNETSFFRDTHPWETLRTELLPELIEARSAIKRLTMWCGATSSGQEPFSLAMLIHEHFPEVAATWTVRISGIDLSPTMVHKSNEGRFSQLEVNRGLPATMLMKYFKREGKDWQVAKEVLDMVDFREGNLIDPATWAKVPLVDCIFIRNVLIYFDKPTRQGILDRTHDRLRSDGFLMLGSSETAVGLDSEYQRIQFGKTVVFRPLVADRVLESSTRSR
jgi:chemotaxis protein methyltransferase CheR